MIVAVAELMDLRGMPASRRGIEKLLARINVSSAGRGRRELGAEALQKLSESQRAAVLSLLARQVSNEASGSAGQTAVTTAVSTGRTRLSAREPVLYAARKVVARAEAKTEIVHAFDRFRKKIDAPLNKAVALFVSLCNSGELDFSAQTRKLYPRITAPSLLRDLGRFKREGAQGLMPRYGNRRGQSIVERDAELLGFIISNLAHNPHVRAPFLLRALRVRFPNKKLPELSALKDFLRRWKTANPEVLDRIADSDGWRHRRMISLGRMDADSTRVNQRWEVDGSIANVFTKDGNKRLRRLHILAVIDVYSRRAVVLVSENESSDAFAALLIKAIELLGVPETIRCDNGSGFISERSRRALARLGISIDIAPPYRPDRKGFVERLFGTIDCCYEANAPGYCGSNVVEASKRRARNSFAERRKLRRSPQGEFGAALSDEQYGAWLDQCIADYNGRKHGSLAGLSPTEVFVAGEARGEVRRLADNQVLYLLLGQGGTATVTNRGLRISNRYYWADEFIGLGGQQVEYRHLREAGRLVVFSTDDPQRFIGCAFDPEAVGLDRQVLAIAARQRQAAMMRAKKLELRRLRSQHKPERLYQEILSSPAAKEAAELLPNSNIVPLPYRNEAIAAAAAALNSLPAASPPEQPRMSVRAEREAARLRKDEALSEARWRRYKKLRDEPVDLLSEDDRKFLRTYSITADCRVRERLEGSQIAS